MSKCVYCNKETENPQTVTAGKEKDTVICCSDECAEKTQKFYDFVDKSKIPFWIGIALSMALLFSGVFAELFTKSLKTLSILIALSFILLGVTAIVFPFATPQTFERFGIKKATLIARILGACIVVLGPLLGLFVMSP